MSATEKSHASQKYTVGYLSYESKKLNKEVGIGKDKRVDDIKCSDLKNLLIMITKDGSNYFSAEIGEKISEFKNLLPSGKKKKYKKYNKYMKYKKYNKYMKYNKYKKYNKHMKYMKK